MLTRILFFLILSAISINADAQVKIRLFFSEKTESVIVRVNDENHTLYFNGEVARKLSAGEIILISKAGDKVAINTMSGEGYLADSIYIEDNSGDSYLNLEIPDGKRPGDDYSGHLTFISSIGILKIVNTVSMESYIGGVVQAEAGYKGHPNYFKAQALIARTYAYLHLNRHIEEGYNICDDVHCQVYHGRSVSEVINEAVESTRNQVLVDSDSLLILTPFHSNCGGQTSSSEDVWLTSKPYLESVIDPYCSFSKNAEWERSIDRSEWFTYIKSKGFAEIEPPVDYTFSQSSRIKNYTIGKLDIPLVTLRTDWSLRSTLFKITDKGDKIHLSGRGYGHGVGLCQEGAFVMANRGFSFFQILNFYYKDIKLINIDDVKIKDQVELSF